MSQTLSSIVALGKKSGNTIPHYKKKFGKESIYIYYKSCTGILAQALYLIPSVADRYCINSSTNSCHTSHLHICSDKACLPSEPQEKLPWSNLIARYLRLPPRVLTGRMRFWPICQYKSYLVGY